MSYLKGRRRVEGWGNVVVLFSPFFRVPVYLYTALFIFAVHLFCFVFFFQRQTMQKEESEEMYTTVVSVKEEVVRLQALGWG